VSEDNPPPAPPPLKQIFWPDTSAEDGQWLHAVTSARTRMTAHLTVLTLASHQMLARARQLSTGNETDRQLAVIFAQSACELHTEKALTDLLRHRAPPLNDAVVSLLGNTISLDDHRVRKVYGALTDDYPSGHTELKQPPTSWWTGWRASRDLRHEVAHEGKPVTSEQADRSIASAAEYIEHLTKMVATALARPAA
jgi:hypothetical protein